MKSIIGSSCTSNAHLSLLEEDVCAVCPGIEDFVAILSCVEAIGDCASSAEMRSDRVESFMDGGSSIKLLLS